MSDINLCFIKETELNAPFVMKAKKSYRPLFDSSLKETARKIQLN